jgi:hypothetical protein
VKLQMNPLFLSVMTNPEATIPEHDDLNRSKIFLTEAHLQRRRNGKKHYLSSNQFRWPIEWYSKTLVKFDRFYKINPPKHWNIKEIVHCHISHRNGKFTQNRQTHNEKIDCTHHLPQVSICGQDQRPMN